MAKSTIHINYKVNTKDLKRATVLLDEIKRQLTELKTLGLTLKIESNGKVRKKTQRM